METQIKSQEAKLGLNQKGAKKAETKETELQKMMRENTSEDDEKEAEEQVKSISNKETYSAAANGKKSTPEF
jgi:hypothetical protein